MNYFAYGANLSKAHMARLCPGAKPRFSATLPNYRLQFTVSSRTEGGTATLKLTHGERVPGAVYEVDAACLRALDKYEGYPREYDRMNVIVFNDFGDAVEAVTYMKTRQWPEGQPGAEYIRHVQQGYRDWGLI
jgi:gamma-glutamylcyclotransferase (GGCT)/AIG2-like uncharacterized protein YtfP